MKILVINGANLDLLGRRDPKQYGHVSLKEIEELLNKKYPDITFIFFQSPIEGEIVKRINSAIDENINGIIINPGGYAHTSVVIRDALDIIQVPKVEVHLSNLAARELFRQTLITASVCNGYISGLKEFGYAAAVESIINLTGGKID